MENCIFDLLSRCPFFFSMLMVHLTSSQASRFFDPFADEKPRLPFSEGQYT